MRLGVRSAIAVLATAAVAAGARAQGGAGELIGPGIVRITGPGYIADPGAPSMALVEEPKALGPAPQGFRVTPVFERSKAGKPSVRVAVEAGTSLYGTGEVAGPLLRNGRKTVAWNTDSFAYTEETPSLYQSHPWVLAVREDGTAYGVLADTTWRCEIDLADGIRFTADGPEPGFAVVVIDRSSPQEVVTGLADLTGKMPMPPQWAIGYHQCRYSYNPESKVRQIAKGFRDRHIPCDVIWMDIDYMNGYRVFTFDPEQFPNPTALNADLHQQGFHTIWMIDPGVKAEPGYAVYDSGTAGDHWVKRADGSVYKGEVWPGWCVFPDFTRAPTRRWWAGLYKDFLGTGVDGVWNDMNEPAVFNVPSKTMPEDNVHRGGDGLGAGPHAPFHNVYGMLMARGTREGIQAASPDKRPFVLTRANYLGGQRYAATWTGDNSAEWGDLEASIPMILNLGLSGQPFAGPDIGGFNGNGNEATRARMFARWMGIGALLPFARGHTAKGNVDKEPWAFGPETETTCRQALQRRYRLLPYLYTVFREASQTGLPVVRPLFFADPKDAALRSEDDAFLLGADLLVAAKVTPLGDREPALPKGDWRRIDLVTEGANPDLPVLRIRSGAILPLAAVSEYTGQRALDPVMLLANLDEHGHAEGMLYEDAGDGYGYRDGQYLLTRYVAQYDGTGVTVAVASTEGKMARPARRVFVDVLIPAMLAPKAATFTPRGKGRDGEPMVIPIP